MARLENPHRFLLDLDKVLRQPLQDKTVLPRTNGSVTANEDTFVSKERITLNQIISIHQRAIVKMSSPASNEAIASQFRILGGALYYVTALSLGELKEGHKNFVTVTVAPAAGAVNASQVPVEKVRDYLVHDGTVFGLCALKLTLYSGDFLDGCVRVIVTKSKKIIAHWTTAQLDCLLYYVEKHIREVGHGLSGQDRKKFSFIADIMNRCSEVSNGRRIKFPRRTWNAIDTRIKKYPTTKAAYANLLTSVLHEMGTPGYVAPDMPERLVWGDGDVIDEGSDEGEGTGVGVRVDMEGDHDMEGNDFEEKSVTEGGADIEEEDAQEDSDDEEDSGDEEEDFEGEIYGLGYGNNYEF